jgi:hypothetical protein
MLIIKMKVKGKNVLMIFMGDIIYIFSIYLEFFIK